MPICCEIDDKAMCHRRGVLRYEIVRGAEYCTAEISEKLPHLRSLGAWQGSGKKHRRRQVRSRLPSGQSRRCGNRDFLQAPRAQLGRQAMLWQPWPQNKAATRPAAKEGGASPDPRRAASRADQRHAAGVQHVARGERRPQ